MSRFTIETVEDARVGEYRDLPRTKASRSARHFVAEGRWLVHRLLQSEVEIFSIFCIEQYAEEFAEVAEQVPLYLAERSLVEQIVGFEFHRGVLACGRRPRALTLADLAGGRRERALYAVCVSVGDPENLGGVIRNCAALGADALLVDRHCADPFSRRVLRVSMGAALSLPIVESSDLKQDLVRLRNDWNFELTSAVLSESASPLEQARPSDRSAIIFGNEGYGLSEEWLQLCDRHVTLPMQGGVESLNVAVASGQIMQHFSRMQPEHG